MQAAAWSIACGDGRGHGLTGLRSEAHKRWLRTCLPSAASPMLSRSLLHGDVACRDRLPPDGSALKSALAPHALGTCGHRHPSRSLADMVRPRRSRRAGPCGGTGAAVKQASLSHPRSAATPASPCSRISGAGGRARGDARAERPHRCASWQLGGDRASRSRGSARRSRR